MQSKLQGFMKIVFMGTPLFAVPSLEILVNHGYEVVGVITSTDSMGGRGRKEVIQSDVKKYALEKNLKILQPSNLKSPAFLRELKALDADLQIVVAFRMLPEAVWNMPQYGTYNLHGSLLPKYRGAAPIHWAVINGEKETGVTSFKLKHEIDTGDLLFQESMPIYNLDTTGSVHDRMMLLAADVVLRTVQAIEKGHGEVALSPQDNTQVSKAPKLFHDDCEINFDQKTEKVYNHIRGLSPYPSAWCLYQDKKMKIDRADYYTVKHDNPAGNIEILSKNELRIYCKDGYILPKVIQIEGKKKMPIAEYLRGVN